MNWIEETGFKVGIFLAGCAGALASFLQPQKLKWHERLLTILVGGLSAMYLTPFAVGVFEIVRPMGNSGELFLAFLVGYSGLKSIELAIVELKKRLRRKP